MESAEEMTSSEGSSSKRSSKLGHREATEQQKQRRKKFKQCKDYSYIKNWDHFCSFWI